MKRKKQNRKTVTQTLHIDEC